MSLPSCSHCSRLLAIKNVRPLRFTIVFRPFTASFPTSLATDWTYNPTATVNHIFDGPWWQSSFNAQPGNTTDYNYVRKPSLLTGLEGGIAIYRRN